MARGGREGGRGNEWREEKRRRKRDESDGRWKGVVGGAREEKEGRRRSRGRSEGLRVE